ncbi:MAG: late competence development ComFB family protein [Leptolyngbya sp. SIOISBB]|nr:late competence development ComFB family protein [Leptolyngbya sp. SIOISBB]
MSSKPQLTQPTTHFNVMELLVADEVDRQLKGLPARLAKYLKRNEIETFALNRLPALYATSEKGLEYQRVKAYQELPAQVTQAVQQALAAVQGDPLRASQPLQISAPQQQADTALSLLRQWMETPDLTWAQALQALAECQRQRSLDGDSAPPASAKSAPPIPRSSTNHGQKYAQKASELNSTALRPGVYGCRTAWIPKQRQAQSWQRDRSTT